MGLVNLLFLMLYVLVYARIKPTVAPPVPYDGKYDVNFAKNNGLPDIILHGALKNAFLGQLMTDYVGFDGTLKKLSCQYRAMDIPGTPVFAKGTVVKKYVEENENIVECEIWLENEEGQKTTPGYAIVSLPNRS